MAVVARLYQDMRDAERYAVAIDGTLRNAYAEPQDVVVEDLSATGFRTDFATGLAIGDIVTLGLYGAGLRSARVMREDSGRFACQFLVALTEQELAFALVQACPPEPIRFPVPSTAQPEAALETSRQLSPRMRLLVLAFACLGPWVVCGIFWFGA